MHPALLPILNTAKVPNSNKLATDTVLAIIDPTPRSLIQKCSRTAEVDSDPLLHRV